MKVRIITEVELLDNSEELDWQLSKLAYRIADKVGQHLAEQTVFSMKNEIVKELKDKFQVNIILEKRGWLERLFNKN